MLNKIIEQKPSSNKILQFLQEVALDYINNIGSENLTQTSNLRKQVKLSVQGQKLNPTKTFYSIIKGVQKTVNLGFYFKIKKIISCSCSAFYGKKLDCLGSFTINCSNFLEKNKSRTIHELYQTLEIPFKPEFITKLVCPDPSCEGKITEETIEFDSIPLNFTLNLTWESDPEPLEILKILTSLKLFINSSQLINSKKNKNFIFKGLILQNTSKEYVYCTTGPDSEFYIIDKNKYLKVAGGTWINAVYNLSVHGFKPVIVQYTKTKQDSADFMEINELEALEMAVAQQTGEFNDWICLCCDTENSPESETCEKCKMTKQSKIKDWECKCSYTNKAFTTICSFCQSFRFNYNTGKCGVCKKNKVGKECIHCNRFKCGIMFCFNESIFGQLMVHIKCGEMCSGFCETCNENLDKFNSICLLCHDLYKHCQHCNIIHRREYECYKFLELSCNVCYQSLNGSIMLCKYCKFPVNRAFCVFCKSIAKEVSVCNECLMSFNSE